VRRPHRSTDGSTEEPRMSDNHGNTPAAWTAVTVAMLGFVVGAVGLLLEPVSMTIFWVGVALGVASLVIFAVMVKLGFHESGH
jgi:cyanate permease